MSKITVTMQDGSTATRHFSDFYTAGRFYDYIAAETPENIRTYHIITLYDDLNMGIHSHSHLTEKKTREIFRDIQNVLKDNKLPLYGMDDSVIARFIHFTDKAFADLGKAFRAYHVTEKQGGCWVFE